MGHSSDDDQKNIENFMSAGADFFEMKPVDVESLLMIIRSKILTQLY